MVEDPQRIFKLKLSLALGCHIDVIEEMDNGLILEYQALNMISPFTEDRQAHQLGLIAALLYNQNATKKSQTKSPVDLFPYLDNNTDFLEPELYIKARGLIKSLNPAVPMYSEQLADIKGHIKDTIDDELLKVDSDEYLVRQLKSLL